MLTPQEVQERTFEKAVFGGYDMGEVDDFLDILTEDYTNLYKENAVLKNKMKVLVRAVEEYREKEQSMNSAIQSAQRGAVSPASQARAAAGEGAGAEKAAEASRDIAAQEERLKAIRKSVEEYVNRVRELLCQEQALLDTMLTHAPAPQAAAQAAAPAPKAQPAPIPQAELDEPTVKFTSAADDVADDVADEIERSIRGNFKEDEAQPRKPKFEFIELQFGKDYEL